MFNVHSYNREFLDFWNARMCRPCDEPLVDSVVVAVLKQQGFTDIDYVPRNLYDPDALYQAIDMYAPERSHLLDMRDPGVTAGLRLAFKAFARPTDAPLLDCVRLDGPLWKVFRLLEVKGEKSAGLTAIRKSKAEAFPVAMRKVTEQLSKKRAPEPCLAGVRTQAGKLGRLVWGYPLSMTIIEGTVARPLLEQFKSSRHTPMAFGQTSLEMGMKMRRAIAHNDHYVSMDASKFDATIQAGVIKYAFNALRTWFDLNSEVKAGVTVGEVFDIIEDYFLRTPIVMPSSSGPLLYRGKRHGVPSGSYFTQLVDSFANVALIGCLDQTFKLKIHLDEIFVLGDDMLFFTNKVPNLGKYAQILSEKFFMSVNAEKSSTGPASHEFHFLGREWNNGIPFREMTSAVERAVSPERYRHYGEDKFKGASLVISSYGFTSMLRGIPERFDPFMGLAGSSIPGKFASGLTAFLLEEGIISKYVMPKLY